MSTSIVNRPDDTKKRSKLVKAAAVVSATPPITKQKSSKKTSVGADTNVCDICWYMDGHRGMTLQTCCVCRVSFHNECYGVSDGKSKDPNLVCLACQAVGKTFRVWRKPSKKEMNRRKPYHLKPKLVSITVTSRPTECCLCGTDNGEEYLHAMHPVYDDHGLRGRQILLPKEPTMSAFAALNPAAGRGRRLAWAHTLCCLAICAYPRTAGIVYGCRRDGSYDCDDIDNDDDVSVDGSVNSQLVSRSAADDSGDDDNSDDPFEIHHYVYITKKRESYKEWFRALRSAKELKCRICGLSDQGDSCLRIALQCAANDQFEIPIFKGAHKHLVGDESCTLAQHTGCALWRRNDYGEWPNVRRVYFNPGINGDAKINTFCQVHALDVTKHALVKIPTLNTAVHYPRIKPASQSSLPTSTKKQVKDPQSESRDCQKSKVGDLHTKNHRGNPDSPSIEGCESARNIVKAKKKVMLTTDGNVTNQVKGAMDKKRKSEVSEQKKKKRKSTDTDADMRIPELKVVNQTDISHDGLTASALVGEHLTDSASVNEAQLIQGVATKILQQLTTYCLESEINCAGQMAKKSKKLIRLWQQVRSVVDQNVEGACRTFEPVSHNASTVADTVSPAKHLQEQSSFIVSDTPQAGHHVDQEQSNFIITNTPQAGSLVYQDVINPVLPITPDYHTQVHLSSTERQDSSAIEMRQMRVTDSTKYLDRIDDNTPEVTIPPSNLGANSTETHKKGNQVLVLGGDSGDQSQVADESYLQASSAVEGSLPKANMKYGTVRSLASLLNVTDSIEMLQHTDSDAIGQDTLVTGSNIIASTTDGADSGEQSGGEIRDPTSSDTFVCGNNAVDTSSTQEVPKTVAAMDKFDDSLVPPSLLRSRSRLTAECKLSKFDDDLLERQFTAMVNDVRQKAMSTNSPVDQILSEQKSYWFTELQMNLASFESLWQRVTKAVYEKRLIQV